MKETYAPIELNYDHVNEDNEIVEAEIPIEAQVLNQVLQSKHLAVGYYSTKNFSID